MSESWQKKKDVFNKTALYSIITIFLVVIGVVLFNNRELLITAKEDPSPETGSVAQNIPVVPVAPQKTADTGRPASLPEKVVVPEKPVQYSGDDSIGVIPRKNSGDTIPGPVGAGLKKKKTSPEIGVTLPSVECQLGDRKRLIIKVSLRVLCSTKAVEQEVLFKRGEITILVKKVFREKQLPDIIVDKLREELKGVINTLLEKGTIEDVEFVEFKPVMSGAMSNEQ